MQRPGPIWVQFSGDIEFFCNISRPFPFLNTFRSNALRPLDHSFTASIEQAVNFLFMVCNPDLVLAFWLRWLSAIFLAC